MKNSEELVKYLIKRGILKTPRIIKAFETIDRKDFVENTDAEVYGDFPLSIGYGQTISQPYTVAFMLEKLQPDLGDRILDIGSGSGWTTALLAQIVGANGQVIGLEIIQELVIFGQNNLTKYQYLNAKISPAENHLGVKDEQFDLILVSAAASRLPTELVDQLRVGGRMLIPIEQSIVVITKTSDNDYDKKNYYGFSFVPLIH